MTYLGDCDFLLNFYFRGGDNRGVLLRRQVGELDFGGAPSLVAERTTGGRLGWDVAYKFDQTGVLRGGLRIGTLYAVDYGSECDVAGDGIAALIVKFAHGGADLVVG